MAKTGSFRMTVWDPPLILAQIIAMQTVYYVVAGLVIAIFCSLFGLSASLQYLFDYRSLKTDYVFGWLVGIAFIVASLAGSVALLILVTRAKQCFDFAATLHAFHFVICVGFAGFPTSVIWWAVNATSFAIMMGLGEYLCLQRELLPITIAGTSLSTSRHDVAAQQV